MSSQTEDVTQVKIEASREVADSEIQFKRDGNYYIPSCDLSRMIRATLAKATIKSVWTGTFQPVTYDLSKGDQRPISYEAWSKGGNRTTSYRVGTVIEGPDNSVIVRARESPNRHELKWHTEGLTPANPSTVIGNHKFSLPAHDGAERAESSVTAGDGTQSGQRRTSWEG